MLRAVTLATFAACTQAAYHNMKGSDDRIVPDVINRYGNVKLNIVVTSHDKTRSLPLVKGMHIMPDFVSLPPKIEWYCKPTEWFTMVLTGPDNPSRGARDAAPIVNWVVVNIPGNKWQEGETLIPYKGPAPGPESGYHRYIFLLYHQAAGKMEFEGEERLSPPLASIHKRINWKARLFSSIHKIGDPVGMTYFSSNYGGPIKDLPPAPDRRRPHGGL